MVGDQPTQSNRDSLGRRSRFVRTATGKHLVLSERDITIFHWLYRYRYLRQSHLEQILQPKSPKRFTERLGDLFHETGLINRPLWQQSQFDTRATPMLYEISNKGIAYLNSLGRLPRRAVTFSRRSPRSYSPQHAHTMLVIETLLEIELNAMLVEGERFVPVDEILTKAPHTTRNAPNPLSVPMTLVPNAKHRCIRRRQDTHVIPDALYGIEYRTSGKKLYRFWALECERTTPTWRSSANASSVALKRAAYDVLVTSKAFQEHWGIPNLKLHLVDRRAD